MIHKLSTHKINSQINTHRKIQTYRNDPKNFDSPKIFNKFRLTKMIYKIQTHKNDSQDLDSQK